jgi:hypothetical protein
VSGMGGMGGWREKELAKRERLEEWGAEGEKSDSEDQDEGGGDYGEIDRPGGTRRGEREKLSKAEKVRLKEEQKWACEDAAGGLGEERKTEVWEEGDADDDVCCRIAGACRVLQSVSGADWGVGIHYGHDAAKHEHRPRLDRLRQGLAAMGRLIVDR